MDGEIEKGDTIMSASILVEEKKTLKAKIEELKKQENKLLAELSKHNEVLLGAENPENAQKIAAMEAEKAGLNSELQTANSKVKTINKKIEEVSAQIAQISDDKFMKKLFDYISSTRWFFFENRKMFLFDKWSGLLWANLEHFTPNELDLNSAKNESNKINWHDLQNWRLPTRDEFWFMISDKSFPFQEGRNYRIHNSCYWQTSEGRIDLDSSGPNWTATQNACPYLPCNSSFATDAFRPATIEKFISEAEEQKKIEDLLSFFGNQGWVPKFKDKQLAEIYHSYQQKPQLLEKISLLEIEISELYQQSKKSLITVDFNYQTHLLHYNLQEVNSSALKFYRNSIAWLNNLIICLDDFSKEHYDYISTMLQIHHKVNAPYISDDTFSEEENQYLALQQEKLKVIFDFDFDIVKQKLYGFKEEAEAKLSIIERVGSEQNRLQKLAEIEQEQRPDFAFFAEYTGDLIQEKMKKFSWYEKQHENITLILKKLDGFYQDYKIFTDKTKADFFKKSKEESIEMDKSESWFSEWRKERFVLIKKALALINNFAFEKVLNETIILSLFGAIEAYRKKMDAFYSNETLSIHQKYAFQQGGDLQEKFEREIGLAKVTNEFAANLQKILFECDNSADKIYLIRWSKEWLDDQIEEIILFAEKNKLHDITPVFCDAIEQLRLLKRQNLEVFLNDINSYSMLQKKRNDEYHSLMFKMRKELTKGK